MILYKSKYVLFDQSPLIIHHYQQLQHHQHSRHSRHLPTIN
jgi:hypothetical protein